MVELPLLVFAFLVLSGGMAMLDAAFLSVTQGEVEESVVRDQWGARALRIVISGLPRTVIVIVILTNTINVLGPILIGVRASYLFGNQVLGILTAFLTSSTIIFSEIIPKIVGTRYAPLISRTAAPFVRILVFALYPLVIALELIAKPFHSGERRMGTEEQIRALASIGEDAGHILKGERQLIHRTFALNDHRAGDIMVPLERVIAVDVSSPIQEVAKLSLLHPHTRYLVISGSLRDVRGFLRSREVLRALMDGKGAASVGTLTHEIISVDKNMRADELLILFRDRRTHIAVVKDGTRVLGLVTLKDVLEELVGNIGGESEI